MSARGRAAAAVALAVAFAACGSSTTGTRNDVRAYLQRAAGWAPVEAETARTLDRILATEFVDEAEVRHQIADSRPRILAHLERVRSVPPPSGRLATINEKYVNAWQQLLAGYGQIEEGFSSGDYTKLARGREAMAAWRDGLVIVARELRQLASEVGVEPAPLTQS